MIQVEKICNEAWRVISQNAHALCFNERRDPEMDRIDFALLNVKIEKDEKTPLNYCTVKELDSESVYWQYGGAFPNTKGTPISLHSYKRNADWCFAQGYKRITTYIQNINTAMLKVAIHIGFIPIGVRYFKGEIFVELLLERNNEQ